MIDDRNIRRFLTNIFSFPAGYFADHSADELGISEEERQELIKLHFVICCDLLSSVRLQLTAVIQLALWMLVKLDKISETPVFSRLSDLAPIIT